jgi:DUF4097 and DUF4098 domain-containing protein YvlB
LKELSIALVRNTLQKGREIPMPKHPAHRKPLASVVLVTLVLCGTLAAAGALVQLRVSKMGGDIDYAEVPDGGTFSTMGGNVHLGKVHKDISVSTMGGNITIDSADAYVKASTMGGNVSVGSAVAVDASTMGGNVEATVLKGDSNAVHNITLSSMGGEIIVTLPKDYPMTIDVQLAYTKSKEGQFKITENLGLEHGVSDDWSSWEGSARKKLYARGRIGDGRNHVTIKTINGNVIIKGDRSQL